MKNGFTDADNIGTWLGQKFYGEIWTQSDDMLGKSLASLLKHPGSQWVPLTCQLASMA